jgi:hypothetical protein
MPEDASDLSEFVLADGSDYHSASWLPVRELIPALLRIKEGRDTPSLVADKLLNAELDLVVLDRWLGLSLEFSPEDIDNWRIMFAFDN